MLTLSNIRCEMSRICIHYIQKVPLLHKLLEDKEWVEEKLKVKPEEYKHIVHEMVNFVDDSNNMISFEDETDANHYINRFFDVLKHYYTLNKLKINPEKTNLLIIAKPAMKERNKDIRIVTEKNEDDVYPKKQIRVLGWEMNSRLSMDSSLQKITGRIKAIMSKVKEITPYMTEKLRLLFANSYLISQLNYGIQFYVAENQKTKNAHHRITMTIARWVEQS